MEHALIYKDYNEALKNSRILGIKCAACGTVTTPPKVVCPKCDGTDLAVHELKGEGKIRTFTTVYVAAEGREDEVPYVIVIVELDEGPWIMGNLADIEPADAGMDLVGQAVKMTGVQVFPGDPYAGDGARPLFSLSA
jgi:uncharacterized OB-fold protein